MCIPGDGRLCPPPVPTRGNLSSCGAPRIPCLRPPALLLRKPENVAAHRPRLCTPRAKRQYLVSGKDARNFARRASRCGAPTDLGASCDSRPRFPTPPTLPAVHSRDCRTLLRAADINSDLVEHSPPLPCTAGESSPAPSLSAHCAVRGPVQILSRPQKAISPQRD